MKIPTKQKCFQLMCEMNMLEHIVVHSFQVCRVAVLLANHLNNQNHRLNYNLIQAAALLHDITKTRSFKTGELHAQSGAQFLIEKGYPEVGDLVRQHVRLDKYLDGGNPNEAEIINYADKRVLHDQVVTLEKRMEYILERYGKEPEHQQRIRRIWDKTILLEHKIFNGVSFSPEDISRWMNHEDCALDLCEYQKICARLSAASNDSCSNNI